MVQSLNVPIEISENRKHLRDFSVRQDPWYGRTAHTKCGVYLLRSPLAAALPDSLFEHPAVLLCRDGFLYRALCPLQHPHLQLWPGPLTPLQRELSDDSYEAIGARRKYEY